MIDILPSKKFTRIKVVTWCFLVTVFLLSSCTRNKEPLLSDCLTAEEKQDLDYFFRFLLYENYGAFVLFGSKALCEMNLPDTRYDPKCTDITEWVNAMPENDQKKFRIIQKNAQKRARKTPKLKRNPYQGLVAFEKVQKKIKMKNFIIKTVPDYAGDDQVSGYEVTLVNIQQTAFVLAEHYAIFKEAAGMDFHPLQAVFELQDPTSVLWKNIFSLKNHTAKGLLFGFGLKNSLFGNWHLSCLHGQLELPSEHYKETIADYLKNLLCDASSSNHKNSYSEEPLTHCVIPLFKMVPGDEMADKYMKEKAVIERAYRGKDFVEVTLRRLAGFD